MHVDVMITRFVCAWLMHLECHKEVKQALAMFKYVLNHSKQRGSLSHLCKEVFENKICFIFD